MTVQVLYCLLYAGGIAFLAGSAVRAVRYAKQPMHLRWEIHPVPRGRRGELKFMVPEIAFLKALWKFNRPMWYVSYPFHLGLYLLAAGLLLAGGSAAGIGTARPAAVLCGTAGAALGLCGSLGLLARRATTRELRIYSAPADYFNLVFFAVTQALLLAGYWLRPAGTPGPAAILLGAATWNKALQPPQVLSFGMAAGAILAGYIPMTHMAHFIGKFFTYHQVRWDERANVPGSSIDRKMAEYLMYRPTWSARHVGAGGTRTWADIATTDPTQGGAK